MTYRFISRAAAALAGLSLILAAGSAAAQQPAAGEKASPAAATKQGLIPRNVLFGNPDRAATRLSPDGKNISFLAPVNGVLNIWVAPAGDLSAAKPVTHDTGRGIRQYFWAYTNNHILYLQDLGGDENWKVHAVDLSSATDGKFAVRDLTPFDTVPGPDGKPLERPGGGGVLRPTAQIEGVSDKFPDTILVGLNNRNPQFHDLYRVNIRTGEMTKVMQNDGWQSIGTDEDYRVRFATKYGPNGELEVHKADDKQNFTPWETIGFEDTFNTSPAGFDKSGETLYWSDSRGRNTSALFAMSMKTGEKTLIAEDQKADVGGIIADPKTGKVQAVSFDYDRVRWHVVDPAIQADLDYLRTVSEGDIAIGSRTEADDKWIVGYLVDNGPAKSYLYDRAARKATFLHSNRKELEAWTLARMHPVVITSRDGLNLVSYLSLPPESDTDNDGRPDRPLPMVLNVHGGPWARDSWGFDPEAQWFASRGYATLQVNFRGSTGFGKAFTNAADREWGGKMHDDLLDAVQWAVDNKIADPARVGIYGWSYGGYATLVGMTKTPDVFACGVDGVGVANLNTFIKTMPTYWKPFEEQLKRRVGDFTTDEGKKFLTERSPVTHVGNIKKPLLIGQGFNDPRVNHDESQQVVNAMKAKNIPVTYVLYPDEGHGFARPENRMSYYAVAEAFLAEHLGGKYQPIDNDFKGSSIQVPEGGQHIPGVLDAIGK